MKTNPRIYTHLRFHIAKSAQSQAPRSISFSMFADFSRLGTSLYLPRRASATLTRRRAVRAQPGEPYIKPAASQVVGSIPATCFLCIPDLLFGNLK